MKVYCHTRFTHELPGYAQTSYIITEAEGKIGDLCATTPGMAGIEATFKIITGTESPRQLVVIEVLGWWQYGKYVSGVCIYDYNKVPEYQYDKYVNINPGVTYRYVIHVHSGGIRVRIKNTDNKAIFNDFYQCNAQKILTFQTELEYWHESSAESFGFDGKVTIDDIYHKDTGWLEPAAILSCYEDNYCPPSECCEFLKPRHYADGGSWILEGQVRKCLQGG